MNRAADLGPILVVLHTRSKHVTPAGNVHGLIMSYNCILLIKWKMLIKPLSNDPNAPNSN